MRGWTSKELKDLRHYYAYTGINALMKHFNRSASSINHKALRMGLVKSMSAHYRSMSLYSPCGRKSR